MKKSELIKSINAQISKLENDYDAYKENTQRLVEKFENIVKNII
jgi:molecular chaperone GrpE (heat shock protein)